MSLFLSSLKESFRFEWFFSLYVYKSSNFHEGTRRTGRFSRLSSIINTCRKNVSLYEYISEIKKRQIFAVVEKLMYLYSYLWPKPIIITFLSSE